MKTKIITLALLSIVSITSVFAQDRTTVTANNSEISDNLDLRAVASIFGDSKNLEDFERKLNNPEVPISNLDLNGDNQVDYLRVIETVEGNTHLIVIQSVLGRDLFQDVATVEVEKDKNNRVQVQVVGNVFMYGQNYIYEPVYSYTPVIYSTFWVSNYRPYWSTWYWDYYPSYYYVWRPFPIFRYRNHIHLHINVHHHYNYVNVRRCQTVYNNYYNGGRRGSAYEIQHPNRSFAVRNVNYSNRHELDKTRNIRTVSQRGELAQNNSRLNTRNNAVRNSNDGLSRNNNVSARNENTRNNDGSRNNNITRNETVTPRNNSVRIENNKVESTRNNPSRELNSNRSNTAGIERTRSQSTENVTPRNSSPSRVEAPRSSNNGSFSESKSNSGNRNQGNNGGNRRG